MNPLYLIAAGTGLILFALFDKKEKVAKTVPVEENPPIESTAETVTTDDDQATSGSSNNQPDSEPNSAASDSAAAGLDFDSLDD